MSIYKKCQCANNATLVCSSGTVAIVVTKFYFILFFIFLSRPFVPFFSFKYLQELTYILLYWHEKFHNIFTIIEVSIFYRSKWNNKIWNGDQTTTENKCFVRMLWHLLGVCVKATVLLVCSMCIVHRFLFLFLVICLCSFF